MRRNYPLYLVDTSRTTPKYNFDYVACFDNTYAFVAQVIEFKTDEMYFDFIRKNENPENNIVITSKKLAKGGVVLSVVEYLYDFDGNEEAAMHISSLLKRGLKKYLFVKYTGLL